MAVNTAYPGVYLDEIATGLRPIEDVPAGPNPVLLETLAAEIARTMRMESPGWTEHDAGDPGVTLVTFAAWLAESLQAGYSLSERGRAVARVAASRWLVLASQAPASDQLTRPHFFPGRLLDATTLQDEQRYQIEKLRRHNRALVGFGVVAGLGVTLEGEGSGTRIAVEAGFAIDPLGNEIVLPTRSILPLNCADGPCYVALRYAEMAGGAASVPSRTGVDTIERLAFAHIRESFVLELTPTPMDSGVMLARLHCAGGSCAPDPTFVPASVRGVRA